MLLAYHTCNRLHPQLGQAAQLNPQTHLATALLPSRCGRLGIEGDVAWGQVDQLPQLIRAHHLQEELQSKCARWDLQLCGGTEDGDFGPGRGLELVGLWLQGITAGMCRLPGQNKMHCKAVTTPAGSAP